MGRLTSLKGHHNNTPRELLGLGWEMQTKESMIGRISHPLQRCIKDVLLRGSTRCPDKRVDISSTGVILYLVSEGAGSTVVWITRQNTA